MTVNFSTDTTDYSSITLNSLLVHPNSKQLNLFQECLRSKTYAYLKKGLFIIFVLNLMGWGNLLLFISVGAANNTMPDEETRKVWIEISFQVVNGLLFVMILLQTPSRICDFYQFYHEKYRPRVLERHQYTNNLIWLHFIFWSSILNSICQFAVSICLWSMDMHRRPMWVVNVFGGLGLVSGLLAGLAPCILRRFTKRASREHPYTETI